MTNSQWSQWALYGIVTPNIPLSFPVQICQGVAPHQFGANRHSCLCIVLLQELLIQ